MTESTTPAEPMMDITPKWEGVLTTMVRTGQIQFVGELRENNLELLMKLARGMDAYNEHVARVKREVD